MEEAEGVMGREDLGKMLNGGGKVFTTKYYIKYVNIVRKEMGTEKGRARERGRKERERGKGGGREQRHTCTRDLTTCSL